jgi:hypothetical protein
VGDHSGTAAVATPLPDLESELRSPRTPQGGRKKIGASVEVSVKPRRTHFANSFSPNRMSCAVSAFSPAEREAAAMAAAACGWP